MDNLRDTPFYPFLPFFTRCGLQGTRKDERMRFRVYHGLLLLGLQLAGLLCLIAGRHNHLKQTALSRLDRCPIPSLLRNTNRKLCCWSISICKPSPSRPGSLHRLYSQQAGVGALPSVSTRSSELNMSKMLCPVTIL